MHGLRSMTLLFRNGLQMLLLLAKKKIKKINKSAMPLLLP
jgi:hypothetical protein